MDATDWVVIVQEDSKITEAKEGGRAVGEKPAHQVDQVFVLDMLLQVGMQLFLEEAQNAREAAQGLLVGFEPVSQHVFAQFLTGLR